VTDTMTPDPAALASENATLRTTLAEMQADNARLLSESQIVAKGATESQAALTAAIRDRDAFKVEIEALKPKAALVADLEVKITGYVNAGRELALVEALRAKLPGAEPLAIRGVISQLHEAGKVNRYPEDPAAEVAKALPIITAEAPSLARPLTGTGGSSLLRQGTTAPPKSMSLFR